MNNHQVSKGVNLKVIGVSGIALAALCIFLNISEFYKVGILQETGGYPFGGEGPTPWYYKSAQVYAYHNLSIGLLFLAASLLMFWGLYKNNNSVVATAFGVTMFLFVIQLIA